MALLAPLILVGLVLLGIFTLVNWGALSAPTTLSFIVFELVAPLGLLLLGTLAVFVALFTVYVLMLRTQMLVQARRHAKALQAQQTLAEQAEASRLSALRTEVGGEFARMRDASERARAAFGERLDALEQTLLKAVDESNSSLAACVGEVEDKLDRQIGHVPPEQRL